MPYAYTIFSSKWYHGVIDRNQAEELLRAIGLEGAFLIRQSATSTADNTSYLQQTDLEADEPNPLSSSIWIKSTSSGSSSLYVLSFLHNSNFLHFK